MQTDRKEPNRIQRSSINHLVLIDREADYVTPLLTQQVYTGILDDWFTIDCGQVRVPISHFIRIFERWQIEKNGQQHRVFPIRLHYENFVRSAERQVTGISVKLPKNEPSYRKMSQVTENLVTR